MLPQFFLATVATTRKQGSALQKGETAMETETIQRHCVEAAAFMSAAATRNVFRSCNC
jgi:hypothetical protein